MMDVSKILDAREERYGTFIGQAEVAMKLKTVIKNSLAAREKKLAFDQLEAIDMICSKLGRIVNGDPNYTDSWIDIAGYAKLVADRLEEQQ